MSKQNTITLTHITPQVQQVQITPKLAQEWLKHNLSNRNLRPAVVDKYALDMRNGDWQFTGDAIRFDIAGTLIDGQHRLHAIIKSGMTILTLVITGLPRETQKVMDTNAKRSATDALKFHGVKSNPTIIAAVARIDKSRNLGMLQKSTSTGRADITNSEVLEWFDANRDSAEAGRFSMRIYRDIGATPSPLAYCIWVLSRIDEEAATEFFNSLGDFAIPDKRDPRAVLLKTLSRMRANRERLTEGHQIYLFFRTWNAWRDGSSRSSIKSVYRDSSGKQAGVSIPEPK